MKKEKKYYTYLDKYFRNEQHRLSKLLIDSTVSKFATGKSIEVNDLSGGEYSVKKNIRFKTPLLRSSLCDTDILLWKGQ